MGRATVEPLAAQVARKTGTDPFRVDGRWISGGLDEVLQYQPCASRG